MGMDYLSLHEAQLYRLLSSFFGKDQVIFGMSVMAVCGGELPSNGLSSRCGVSAETLAKWAKSNKCLFTIVDSESNPRMVIEFDEPMGDAIEVARLEHARFISPVLEASNVRYVTITREEFEEILSADGRLDMVSFLRDKFQISAEGDEGEA